MKKLFYLFAFTFIFTSCVENKNESSDSTNTDINPEESDSSGAIETADLESYYIDVHEIESGSVSFEDVAAAHEKDLATQDKHDVSFVKYWVNEEQGKVYCLSRAKDKESIKNAHQEAHGLVPSMVYKMTHGEEEAMSGDKQLFIDIHDLGPGEVTAEGVAEAHEKDLAVQDKHGVNFINYWVDEEKGVVMCLSEANDSTDVKNAHAEAHGLVPAQIMLVKQGE
jgi:phenolic acid decarboxylase